MRAAARDERRTTDRGDAAPSVRALLAGVRRAVEAPVADGGGLPLEARRAQETPPRIVAAALLESGFTAREVGAEIAPAFTGFLDGVQESRVITWLPAGVPVVLAVIGAVILERGADRRLVAWGAGARVKRTLVAPRALTPGGIWEALSESGPIVDSGAGADARHPDSLLARAVECVDDLRADDERRLAEAWALASSSPLAADGGISSFGTASRSPNIIGIVKSHRTLYADGHELTELFALPVGSRTPAFGIESTGARAPAWSWYLRLRPSTPANPMHGLVRVEIAPRTGELTACADEISRWVLAERTPIALPDARWDVMAYGIARCEAYLKRGLALKAST